MTHATTGQSVARTLLEGGTTVGVDCERSMSLVTSASYFNVISLTFKSRPFPASFSVSCPLTTKRPEKI